MLALPQLLSTTSSRVSPAQLLAPLSSVLSFPFLSFPLPLPISPPIPGWTTSPPSKFPLHFLLTTPETKSYHTQVQQPDKPKTRNPDDTLVLLANLTDNSAKLLDLSLPPSLFSPTLAWLVGWLPSNSSFSLPFPLPCGPNQLWLYLPSIITPPNLSSLRRSSHSAYRLLRFLAYFPSFLLLSFRHDIGALDT